jgi:hypothetical protein
MSRIYSKPDINKASVDNVKWTTDFEVLNDILP